jgi:cell division protein ZapE
MMRDVHAQLKSFEAIEDPLDRVAENIARHTDILCFDELFVSDIADAMIMGRLLDSLFRRGVTLVATSNSPPEDLYRGGLQRDRFLPAIALLEKCTLVIELDGETDYRLRLLQQAGTFLVPHNQEAHDKVQHLFDELAPGKIIENHPLEILGRVIPTQRCAKDVVWFDFSDLCDGPRSQQDYIELARWFQTVIVSNVPILNVGNEDAARRFIALVDEFYDRKVKLLLSAAAPVASLYQGKKLGFEFQRTSSRLIEMQTRAYQHTAHIA